MSILLIIGLIIILYVKTLDFYYIIDDNVKRDGYMFDVPLTLPDPNFQLTKPSKWYRAFMIGMHCVNTWIIYMLWGWCPALLFAVHPMSVWGVAWVTGNYYATTCYFMLISYYILHTFPNIWGALAAIPIFAAGLNSTVCCMSFPFLFALIGNWWGCSLFIPLEIYLRGKRFNTGIKIRDSFKENKPIKMDFTYRRFFVIVKIIGKYVIDTIIPNKLALFTPDGHNINDSKEVYDRWHSCDKNFWVSFLICSTVFAAGMYVKPVGILWFFVVLALHSQWRMTGQFYAQRYVYCALPGICVVAGTLIQHYPILVAVIATFLFFRSFLFVNAFRSNECLSANDLDTFPGYSNAYNTMAQYYLNYPYAKDKPMPAWRINQIGYLLFKAEELDPTSWSIKMNVACFFALIGQWPVCMQKTADSLNLVRPLGGLPHPVQILEQQTKNVAAMIEKNRLDSNANMARDLEAQINGLINFVELQNDPALLPVSTCLKNAVATLDEKKPELGMNLILDLSKKLNELIGMIEKGKVVSDPDMIALRTNVNLMVENRKKALMPTVQPGVANVSPQPALESQKVGT